MSGYGKKDKERGISGKLCHLLKKVFVQHSENTYLLTSESSYCQLCKELLPSVHGELSL